MPNNKLTVKEAKLVKGIVEGKTKRQAAMDAYNSKTIETAAVIASETLRKPNVQEALAEAFRKQGIDIDIVIAPVVKALKAQKLQFNEIDKQYIVGDDLEMQLKGHDRAAKLMGLNQQTVGDVNVMFIDASHSQKADYEL